LTTTPVPATESRRSPGWRLPVLGLLVLLLVASIVFLVLVAVDRRDSDGGGLRLESDSTTSAQRTREELMQRTEQFVLRMGTYGPEDLDDKGKLPGYTERVKEMITTQFATEFDESVQVAEQMVVQFAHQRSVDVYGVGVVSADDDSATVLVAGGFTDKFGKAAADAPIQFRWQVELVTVGGDWLVDDYGPVTAQEGAPAP
jgi:Mce-associated membrane protein